MTREQTKNEAEGLVNHCRELMEDIITLAQQNYEMEVEVASLEATTMVAISEEPDMQNPTKARYSNETARKAAQLEVLSQSEVYVTHKKHISDNTISLKYKTAKTQLEMKYLDFLTSFVANLPA